MSTECTVVIASPDLMGTLCDRLLMIRAGEVVADDETDAVLTPVNLRAVFDVDTEIIRRPDGRRVVVPLPPEGGSHIQS